MNDPRRRKELVAFVRLTLVAAADLQKDPKRYFPLISEKTKHPQDQIARSWEHHGFPLRVAPDLLDLITEEEKWVAAQQNRTPRSRAELAGFIDATILKEAQGRPRLEPHSRVSSSSLWWFQPQLTTAAARSTDRGSSSSPARLPGSISSTRIRGSTST